MLPSSKKTEDHFDCPNLPLSEKQHDRAYPAFVERNWPGFMESARKSVEELEELGDEMRLMELQKLSLEQSSLQAAGGEGEDNIDDQAVKPGYEEEEGCEVEFLSAPTAEHKAWIQRLAVEAGHTRDIAQMLRNEFDSKYAFWPFPAEETQRILHYCRDEQKLDVLEVIKSYCPTRKFLRLNKQDLITMCSSFEPGPLRFKALGLLVWQVDGWYPLTRMTAWDVVDCLVLAHSLEGCKEILALFVHPATGILKPLLHEVQQSVRGTTFALDHVLDHNLGVSPGTAASLHRFLETMRNCERKVLVPRDESSGGRVVRHQRGGAAARRKDAAPFVPRSQVSDLAEQLQALMPAHSPSKEKAAAKELQAAVDQLPPSPNYMRVAFEGETLCTNCGERPIQLIYFPCGDMVFCQDCHENLAENKCPHCKRDIERVLQPNIVKKLQDGFKNMAAM